MKIALKIPILLKKSSLTQGDLLSFFGVNLLGATGFDPPDKLLDGVDMDLEHLGHIHLGPLAILEEIEGHSLLHKGEMWHLQVSNFECPSDEITFSICNANCQLLPHQKWGLIDLNSEF